MLFRSVHVSLIALVGLIACNVEAFQHIKPMTGAFRRTIKFMSDVVDASPPVQSSFTLFIGNLPYDANDDQLRSFVMEKVPEFQVCNVAYDKVTGQSRGFGYLRFPNEEEATAALAILNGLEMQGSKLKVTKAQGAHAKTFGGEHCVFIGNVEKSITENQVMEMCDDILGPKVALRARRGYDKVSGGAKPYVHVDFRSAEDAARAVQELNGVTMMGRDLHVYPARRHLIDKTTKSLVVPGIHTTNEHYKHAMFVGNFPYSVDEATLAQCVNDIVGPGLMTRVYVHTDMITGRPKGFAHVNFKDEESLMLALSKMDGLNVMGRNLRCRMANNNMPVNGDNSHPGTDAVVDSFGGSF